MMRDRTDKAWFSPFTTSSQEMERVYSYNHGAGTELDNSNSSSNFRVNILRTLQSYRHDVLNIEE